MKPTGPLVNSSSVQNKHEEVAFSFVSLNSSLLTTFLNFSSSKCGAKIKQPLDIKCAQ